MEKIAKLTDDLGNNLLVDSNISNLVQNAMNKMVNDIQEKRQKIIAERLKEKLGIELDIEEEQKRLFKRFFVKICGNEEHIYFNDGSISGVLLVKFIKTEYKMSDLNSMGMNIEYKYI